MIAIRVLFIILLFNIFMSFVTNAVFTQSPAYFEDYSGEITEGLPDFINETEEAGGQRIGTNVISVMFGALTFDWMRPYTVSLGMAEDFNPIVGGLNAAALFLTGVAIVEIIWVKREVLSL